ncbi:MAG TPA: ABC transporter permease [Acidimicrobiales bacterium]|jgi:peptide/nickel transport system permease protein|nr:ABC transporter permease [Acidimicrobiales bacterium]|tara:strand:- start:4030 stop:4986 length:957 start_codon:yes stop_codon:yes gene_type:complete
MITFGAMNFLGDPLFNILGPVAADVDNPESLQAIEEAKAQYHLDKSLPERWSRWAWDFVRGDFGVQFSSSGQPPVSNLIKERLPRTLQLMAIAQLIAVGLAIPWSVLAASRANRRTDKVSTVTAFAFVSIPSFAMAVILFYFFSIRLDWLPDTYNATDPFWGFTHDHRLIQLLLPGLTLALGAAAGYQRLLRTDLITTLQEDFILMARSKGVSKRRVLYSHALRPSLFSLITLLAINIGYMIGGSLVVEQYFRIPGIGSAVVEATLREDFPVVLAIVMLVSAGFMVFNYLADYLYTVIDPRVRTEKSGQRRKITSMGM